MRIRSLLFCALLICSAAVAGPKIEFDSKVYDYGAIRYGSDGTSIFRFTNTGNSPLEIRKCVKTCGCTVPEWPDSAIAPGDTGIIKVVYNTQRLGPFEKEILVITNIPGGPERIFVKGQVRP